MYPSIKRRRAGFTLIELMAVVAIIAVLSVTAFANHSRNVKQTRTSEAVMNLERMWQSAIAYFYTEHATVDGQVLPAQFPSSAPATPSEAPSGTKYEPDPSLWTHPTWDALNFSMSSPHNYQYGFYNRSDSEAPPGGGGPAFGDAGPFAGAGGPMGGGAFGGDGKPGVGDKKSHEESKAAPQQKAKVTLCHIPPGNPSNAHTLSVGAGAVGAHLGHGDYLGECNESSGDDDDDDPDEGTDAEPDDGDDDDPDEGTDAEPDDGDDDDPDDGDDAEPDDAHPDDGDDGDDDQGEDDDDDDEQAEVGGDDDDDDGDDDEDGPFADAGGGDGPCAHLFNEDGGGTPGFYLYATGNLDGDQDYGYFYRSVNVDIDCRMQAAPTVMNENPLE